MELPGPSPPGRSHWRQGLVTPHSSVLWESSFLDIPHPAHSLYIQHPDLPLLALFLPPVPPAPGADSQYSKNALVFRAHSKPKCFQGSEFNNYLENLRSSRTGTQRNSANRTSTTPRLPYKHTWRLSQCFPGRDFTSVTTTPRTERPGPPTQSPSTCSSIECSAGS